MLEKEVASLKAMSSFDAELDDTDPFLAGAKPLATGRQEVKWGEGLTMTAAKLEKLKQVMVDASRMYNDQYVVQEGNSDWGWETWDTKGYTAESKTARFYRDAKKLREEYWDYPGDPATHKQAFYDVDYATLEKEMLKFMPDEYKLATREVPRQVEVHALYPHGQDFRPQCAHCHTQFVEKNPPGGGYTIPEHPSMNYTNAPEKPCPGGGLGLEMGITNCQYCGQAVEGDIEAPDYKQIIVDPHVDLQGHTCAGSGTPQPFFYRNHPVKQ